MAILLSGIVTNCTTEHPDLDVLVGADFMIHTNQVIFRNDPNAAPDALFTDLDGIQVTIAGQDAKDVYNMSGYNAVGQADAFKIAGGTLGLLLDPNVPFSVAKDTYKIQFTVTAPGYLTQTVNVEFHGDQRDEFTYVTMVKLSSLPTGVSTATGTVDTDPTSGATTTASTVDTPASTTGTSTTDVTIPAGTILVDESGNPITGGGKLTTEIVSFSGIDEGTSYIPGGSLLLENMDFKDGSAPDDGEMVVGGYASVKMRVGNTEVKTFNGQKVNVNLTLDKGSINPVTDAEYQAGEELEIWSYSDSEGQWKYEATQVLTDVNNDGQMEALFQTSHLTYFMAGRVVRKGWCKKPGFKVTWTGVDVAHKVNAAFKVAYAEKQGSTWKQKCYYFLGSIFDGANIAFPRAPKYSANVTVINIDALKIIYQNYFTKSQLCSGGTLVITDTPPVTNPLLTCTYTAKCSNGTVVFPPIGCTTYAMEEGTTTWKKIYTVDASNQNSLTFTTTKLVAGKKYKFRTYTQSVLGIQEWPRNAGDSPDYPYYVIFDGFHLDFVINNPACK